MVHVEVLLSSTGDILLYYISFSLLILLTIQEICLSVSQSNICCTWTKKVQCWINVEAKVVVPLNIKQQFVHHMLISATVRGQREGSGAEGADNVRIMLVAKRAFKMTKKSGISSDINYQNADSCTPVGLTSLVSWQKITTCTTWGYSLSILRPPG